MKDAIAMPIFPGLMLQQVREEKQANLQVYTDDETVVNFQVQTYLTPAEMKFLDLSVLVSELTVHLYEVSRGLIRAKYVIFKNQPADLFPFRILAC